MLLLKQSGMYWREFQTSAADSRDDAVTSKMEYSSEAAEFAWLLVIIQQPMRGPACPVVLLSGKSP